MSSNTQTRKALSPFTVIVTAVCLSIIGLALLPQLAFKLSPSVQQPSVTINFSMNGATSKVLETEVTSRLEAALARMRSVRKITSSSYNGAGNIRLSLDKHADIDMARFEASTIVRQVWPELPEGTSYPRVTVGRSSASGNDNFLAFTINAEADPSEITQVAERVFKTAFAEVKGVSDVSVSGAPPREWRIRYDADRANSLGIGHSDIVKTVSGSQHSEPIGDVWLELPKDTTVRLANYEVLRSDSVIVPLEAVATLTHKESPPRSYFRINGLNSIYLNIAAAEDANQIATQKEAMAVIENCKRQLPDGYEIHKAYDATEYISAELDKIYFRSGLTTLILLVFVFLTTLNVRSVGVVLFSLMADIAIASIFYFLLDIEMHVYSLASITISLNLMIDNTIVMSDHWRREHNLRAIAPLAAATLTSVAALAMVFFIEGDLRTSLEDFATVMIINLTVSMLVSLFLVPALVDVLGVETRQSGTGPSRRSCRALLAYQRVALAVARHRWVAIVVAILSFGLPTFMLPARMEGEGAGATAYNFVFDHEGYQRDVRPWIDAALGGSLRLFIDKVASGSRWTDNSEVRLHINASMPYGSTLKQMDDVVRKMESLLSRHKEIKQFQTNVRDARRANIVVTFTREAQHSAFPYQLKQEVTSQALELGAGSWNVSGLRDNSFSNEIHDTNGSYRISLWGYNYDELLTWADSVTNHLLTYKRIKEVQCNSQFSYWKDDYTEFVLTPDARALAEHNVSARQVFASLQAMFNRGSTAGAVWTGQGYENIVVEPAQAEGYDIWSMRNMPLEIGGKTVKLSDLCRLERRDTPKSIEKENQQYHLCLQYEYIGSGKVGGRVHKSTIETYAAQMPIGYTIESADYNFSWGKDSGRYYWLLALVIAIMYFIGSILFDSLRLPLVVIAILPFAFIGLFMTFYLFNLNFDQGGFAAMVLLCGITVNSSIYIVCEYQHRLRIGLRPGWHTYLRAFAVKFVPICLTVLSTVLGFVPFLIHADDESFWFSMAAGTIGGLVVSVIGVCLFLPIFFSGNKDK